MAADMIELMALLRGLNRISSTMPPAHRSTVDPVPLGPTDHVLESDRCVCPCADALPRARSSFNASIGGQSDDNLSNEPGYVRAAPDVNAGTRPHLNGPFADDLPSLNAYTPGHTKLAKKFTAQYGYNTNVALSYLEAKLPNVQANPLLDHGSSLRPTISMINICPLDKDEAKEVELAPFVIDYVPIEISSATMGSTPSSTLFVIRTPPRVQTLKLEANESPTSMPEIAPVVPKKEATDEEADASMNVIKASEYKVVEQMGKSLTRISLLALLLGSGLYREALLKVLNTTQVPKEIALDRIREIMGLIFSNYISILDDELPSEGHEQSRALHFVCKCSKFMVGLVMINNGSTLKKVKFFIEDSLITVNHGEDCVIYKETAVPYISIEDDQNLFFHSFETISVIWDYGEVSHLWADHMVGKVFLRSNYVPRNGFGIMVVRIAIRMVESYDSTIQGVATDSDSMT
ncbi:hypothetical protein CRG98_007681 [Punica granatum]|uniref:Uncharacterized protein n=1 Tax=Punica granatum TaxID=22663 RepID=A0A2I0KUA2_PUNGR|nr:hypothetical protein CRG98_007681 [Punica granatum]